MATAKSHSESDIAGLFSELELTSETESVQQMLNCIAENQNSSKFTQFTNLWNRHSYQLPLADILILVK